MTIVPERNVVELLHTCARIIVLGDIEIQRIIENGKFVT